MLDWDDLRFFLAVARHRNLTAAAKELRVSQSTMGRRLASLEGALAVRLLHRTPEGYRLTLAGEGVLEQAERVEAEALAVVRRVGGQDDRLEGTVRIACTETLAAHVLAPCIVDLQQSHPGIRIAVVPHPSQVSLAMREADIAVRLTLTDRNDLIVRRVGHMAFGLYASSSYVQRQGVPDFPSGCPDHHLMTLRDDVESEDQARWAESMAPHALPGLTTSSHEVLIAAARNGGGLACLARFRADADPALTPIATPCQAPASDVYLLFHKDNRDTPRIRATSTVVGVAIQAALPF